MNIFDYEDPAMFEPILAAVIQNDLEAFKMCVEKGCVNNVDKKGNTPLHIAVLLKRKEIFEYIMSLETVRPDVQNSKKVTPLHIAANNSYYEAAVALLEHEDVDVNAKDVKLSTPLHLAADRKNLDLVRKLIEYGADVNATNHGGRTPILDACKAESIEMVALLIEHGAYVHISHFCDQIDLCPFVYCLGKTHLSSFLYEYTFDYVDNTIPIGVLSRVLYVWEFPEIKDLVKRTRRLLIYDKEHDNKFFFSSVMNVEPQTMLLLLKKFRPIIKKVFKKYSNHWLMGRVHKANVGPWNAGENIERAVWSRLGKIYDLLTMLAEKKVLIAFCRGLSPRHLIDELVSCFQQTHDKHRPKLSEMVMLLLSHGMNVYYCDMLCLYDNRHFDIFKICLHMNVMPFPYIRDMPSILPLLIFDIPNTTLDKFYENPRNYRINDDFLARFSGQKLRKLTGSNSVQNVPKLSELARSVVRNAILVNARTCAQFHTAVKSLDIAHVGKDILALYRWLYF